MPITLGILAQSRQAPVATGAYELIESILLTSNATEVNFTGLSTYASTYKHLQIRTTIFSGQANLMPIFFNGNNSVATRCHVLRGNGSAVASFSEANTGQIQYAMYCGSSSIPSNSVLDILDAYSTNKNKTIRSFTSLSNEVALISGFTDTTAAISSIRLPHPNGFNFFAGTRFSLYGIRGA
jgi:hypothetical protein